MRDIERFRERVRHGQRQKERERQTEKERKKEREKEREKERKRGAGGTHKSGGVSHGLLVDGVVVEAFHRFPALLAVPGRLKRSIHDLQ